MFHTFGSVGELERSRVLGSMYKFHPLDFFSETDPISVQADLGKLRKFIHCIINYNPLINAIFFLSLNCFTLVKRILKLSLHNASV